jgi:hypothetical protein
MKHDAKNDMKHNKAKICMIRYVMNIYIYNYIYIIICLFVAEGTITSCWNVYQAMDDEKLGGNPPQR